jgi:hypothetical protein
VRVWAFLAVGAVSVALAVALVVSLTSSSDPQVLIRASDRRVLPTFAMVSSNGTMELYSSRTGRRVRILATLSPEAFTDNGFAYAPDGRSVYYTLIPSHPARRFALRLMRLAVATGRETFVADGAQPALSASGRQLAYAAFPQGLAVRDLLTGQTRTIALRQLGGAAELINATIGWLGDGSEVAVLPSPTAWDLVGRPPRLRWCGTLQTRPVIVFVRVPAPPAPLSADCVHLRGGAPGGASAMTATPGAPKTLLLATDGRGDATVLETVSLTGKVDPVLSIAHALPQSFDPSGTHLLYIVGHSPPKLTEAGIAGRRFTPGRWRDALDLGVSAW